MRMAVILSRHLVYNQQIMFSELMQADLSTNLWHNIFPNYHMIRITHDINEINSPLLATAIHDGHEVRPEIVNYMAIDEFERLREEDPYTGYLTSIASSSIIVNTSRFEVDVNRPRDGAVYRTPEQSWGLKVWHDNVPVSVFEYSLGEYDYFYGFLERTIRKIIEYWGYVVVYDIHTYNFRRNGPETEDDPSLNPEINIGTGTLNREIWGPVAERFMSDLSSATFAGRRLDVRENVKFKGGYLSQWIHEHYPRRSCVLSIEFKKIFMDEWTGAVDIGKLNELKNILHDTLPGVLKSAGAEKERIES